MLQQILRDMWVDPEILAELDETQKQTLFCKMREEQVRRWRVWDDEVSKEVTDKPNLEANGKKNVQFLKGEDGEPWVRRWRVWDDEVSKEVTDKPNLEANGKKNVQFLKGEDGEPWVWVMGEHPDDRSIEDILAEEARQRALSQACQEAHQLRKSVEKELTHLIEFQPLDDLEQKFDLSPKNVDSLEDTLDLYCSVDELRARMEELGPMPSPKDLDKAEYDAIKLDLNKNTMHFNFIEGKRDVRDVIQESGVGVADGVSLRVAAWERRVAAARAGDILRGLRARRARTLRDAQRTTNQMDAVWREQERKAKEAEAAMREIARAAREAHRLSAEIDPPPCSSQAGRPPNREAVLEWFKTQELKKGVGLDEDNKPVDWFHGLISRWEAERILGGCEVGSFLVRVSERVWGYALSYRAHDRCKHYLVEAERGYRLLGNATTTHDSLADLINHHKTVVITESGGELLISPCAPQHPPLF